MIRLSGVEGQQGNYELTISPVRGDANFDGLVDGDDIAPFTQTLLGPPFVAPDHICVADINGDLVANTIDINDFIECILNSGCP